MPDDPCPDPLEPLRRGRAFLDLMLGERVTLSQTAAVAELSPAHFLRRFKAAFRETPHQYLRRRRMERACRLLRDSALPVTEICFEVGFESLGSFSRLFKNRFGTSPQKFRAAHAAAAEARP